MQCSWQPDTKAYLPIPSHLFPVPPGRQVGYGCANYIGVIYQEQLKVEVNLLLRKSHMPRQLLPILVNKRCVLAFGTTTDDFSVISGIIRIARYLCGS